jgi:hypothetical protein
MTGQSVPRPICGGCQRHLQPGDRYIEDTPSGYIGKESSPDTNALLVDLMTHNDGLDGTSDRLVFCEGCTSPGGRYEFKTYGGEDA